MEDQKLKYVRNLQEIVINDYVIYYVITVVQIWLIQKF